MVLIVTCQALQYVLLLDNRLIFFTLFCLFVLLVFSFPFSIFQVFLVYWWQSPVGVVTSTTYHTWPHPAVNLNVEPFNPLRSVQTCFSPLKSSFFFFLMNCLNYLNCTNMAYDVSFLLLRRKYSMHHREFSIAASTDSNFPKTVSV